LLRRKGLPGHASRIIAANIADGEDMDELLRKSALDYHRLPTPGKISVVAM